MFAAILIIFPDIHILILTNHLTDLKEERPNSDKIGFSQLFSYFS